MVSKVQCTFQLNAQIKVSLQSVFFISLIVTMTLNVDLNMMYLKIFINSRV